MARWDLTLATIVLSNLSYPPRNGFTIESKYISNICQTMQRSLLSGVHCVLPVKLTGQALDLYK